MVSSALMVYVNTSSSFVSMPFASFFLSNSPSLLIALMVIVFPSKSGSNSVIFALHLLYFHSLPVLIIVAAVASRFTLLIVPEKLFVEFTFLTESTLLLETVTVFLIKAAWLPTPPLSGASDIIEFF